jgi:hypothetical protein
MTMIDITRSQYYPIAQEIGKSYTLCSELSWIHYRLIVFILNQVDQGSQL